MILDEIIDSTDNVRDVSSKLTNKNGKRTNIAKYYGRYVRIIQVINYAKYFRINFIRRRIYTKNRKENIKPQI